MDPPSPPTGGAAGAMPRRGRPRFTDLGKLTTQQMKNVLMENGVRNVSRLKKEEVTLVYEAWKDQQAQSTW